MARLSILTLGLGLLTACFGPSEADRAAVATARTYLDVGDRGAALQTLATVSDRGRDARWREAEADALASPLGLDPSASVPETAGWRAGLEQAAVVYEDLGGERPGLAAKGVWVDAWAHGGDPDPQAVRDAWFCCQPPGLLAFSARSLEGSEGRVVGSFTVREGLEAHRWRPGATHQVLTAPSTSDGPSAPLAAVRACLDALDLGAALPPRVAGFVEALRAGRLQVGTPAVLARCLLDQGAAEAVRVLTPEGLRTTLTVAFPAGAGATSTWRVRLQSGVVEHVQKVASAANAGGTTPPASEGASEDPAP